ncbi:hypothetical protein [Halogranum rubrum]|uniref:hypothetical protein n=1 Tax=Halogranum rubrum TaxID=553466 RepID=UPI001160D99E|nr:hypothetical protein [Halogranum rubrum]
MSNRRLTERGRDEDARESGDGRTIPVLPGNTIGRVVLVILLNYGQTEDRFPEGNGARARLGWRDWLFGFRVSHPTQ